MRRLQKWVLTAVAGSIIACDGGLPVSPSTESPEIATSDGASSSAQSGHEKLERLLKAEKERIKREKELRKAEFEAARAAWKVLRKQAKSGKAGKLVDLLRCEPKPYEGEVAIIGPEGGTLQIGDHELIVPKGALTEEKLITGEAPTSSLVAVDFSPEGLTFERPAVLSLSYKDCALPGDSDLLLAYIGPGNRILELPVSTDDRDQDEVTGEINHFSRYAVAY
jgi:hypothetical protein